MIRSDRRNFMFKSSALVASTVLSACGGGAGGVSGANAAPVAGGADVVAVPVTNAPVYDTQLLAAVTVSGTPLSGSGFRLSGATSVKAAPFTLGYAFRQGDVPAGKSVANTGNTLQVTPKNVWPDGSLKFAILAGQADVTGGTDTVVALQVIPSQAEGAPLKTAKLRATEIVAEVGCGAFGTASFSGADWDAPFQTWVSGPRMSSWIYRKPVGTDKHLVAWLEVRLWSSGAVEVLPWIENGYIMVASPTNKSATYTFTLGKTQRASIAIDLKHHQRTPLINGSQLSYWLTIDPGVTPRHDNAYLQATELVPSYSAVISNTSAVVTSLAASFTPLQAGNFTYDNDSMVSSGYQRPIGLLPTHDVAYLISDAPDVFAAVVRNGFSAGRYSMHYRDENTLRPLRISSYPTHVIADGQGYKDNGSSTTGSKPAVATGGTGPNWDIAHSPSVGYLAYLITGRWYFMEQVQFAATFNYLGNGDNDSLRSGSKGLMQPCIDAFQTRATAWGLRTLAQALCVTPDSDTVLQTEFANSLRANIDHFHGRYVAKANNPFGFIQSGASGYDGGTSTVPPWMQDFVTAAVGYATCMGLPLTNAYQTKLAEFFNWMAKSVVGRLGAPDGTGFPYMNADVYVLSISSKAIPDYAGGSGPWRSSWAEVYSVQAATLAAARSPSAWLTRDGSMLAGEIMPGENALWGNLMPALAYAVRHNASGAQVAYDRLRAASNYSALSAGFNSSPVWSVRPAGAVNAAVAASVAPLVAQPITGAPAWLNGAAINQWIEIPDTSGAGGAAVDAYSGFAFNHIKNEIMIAAAGGHHDSADNRVVSLALMTDKPTWQLRSASSKQFQEDVAYYADGKPSSRHTYSTTHFVPQVNRLMMFGARFAYGNAHSFAAVSAFNPDTNTWDPAGAWADMPSSYGAVSVRATGDVYTPALAKWSPVSKTWTQPITSLTNDQVRWPMAHDSTRDQLFSLNWGDGEGYGNPAVFATRVALTGNAQVSVTFKPSVALTQFIVDMPSYAGMDYDAGNDNFLFYCGQNNGAGRVYVVKPNNGNLWDMSILPLAGTTRPPATPGSGVNNRFRYVAALKGFILLPTQNSNLFFIRTA